MGVVLSFWFLIGSAGFGTVSSEVRASKEGAREEASVEDDNSASAMSEALLMEFLGGLALIFACCR
jgi:thiol:disulfide interchange protein